MCSWHHFLPQIPVWLLIVFGKEIWDSNAGLAVVALNAIFPNYISQYVAESCDNEKVALVNLKYLANGGQRSLGEMVEVFGVYTQFAVVGIQP